MHRGQTEHNGQKLKQGMGQLHTRTLFSLCEWSEPGTGDHSGSGTSVLGDTQNSTGQLWASWSAQPCCELDDWTWWAPEIPSSLNYSVNSVGKPLIHLFISTHAVDLNKSINRNSLWNLNILLNMSIPLSAWFFLLKRKAWSTFLQKSLNNTPGRGKKKSKTAKPNFFRKSKFTSDIF